VYHTFHKLTRELTKR